MYSLFLEESIMKIEIKDEDFDIGSQIFIDKIDGDFPEIKITYHELTLDTTVGEDEIDSVMANKIAEFIKDKFVINYDDASGVQQSILKRTLKGAIETVFREKD